LACAGPEKAVRADPAPSAEMGELRAEIADLRRENDVLKQRLDALISRVESVQRVQPSDPARRPVAPASSPSTAPASGPAIPADLEVVRMEPPRAQPARPPVRRRSPPSPEPLSLPPTEGPPPLPTDVALREPDTGAVASLGPLRGSLVAQADAELVAARALNGLASAQKLESFAARFPRHPQADNALLEAASAYSKAGRVGSACSVLARCVNEYPAGDVFADALEQLGECRADQGETSLARWLFQRVLSDFPMSSAAKRAEERIVSLDGARSASAPPTRQGAVP
jgi:TolA-binding protein